MTTTTVDSIRRITLRVPAQLHQALAQVAKELSDLLVPAAQAKGLSEKELCVFGQRERKEL